MSATTTMVAELVITPRQSKKRHGGPRLTPSFPIALDGSDDALRTFVGVKVMYDETRVDHARHPQQNREQQVEQRLEWFAADQHGNWREKDRQ